VTAYTGYIDDPGEQWRGTDVLSAGPARREGSLMAVPLRLRHHYVDTDQNTRREKEEDDLVYLARFDGRWRVARLSAVAHHASLATSGDAESPTGPPDVKALRAPLRRAEIEDRRPRAAGAGRIHAARRRRELRGPRRAPHRPGRRPRRPAPGRPQPAPRRAGGRCAVAIKRSDIQYAENLPPSGDFVWSVSSLAPRTDQDSVLADDAPDGYGVVYPSNRDCGIGTDGSCSTG
jgi:hypothetical protein